MEEGMGILRGGSATSEENGPSLGRGIGVGSTLQRATSNGATNKEVRVPTQQSSGMPAMQMQIEKADVSKDANSVPGFPQDAFMEGPVMAMDQMFQKPETYGLRPGWSGFMQGMMTLVRVLPPDQYDHIMQLRQQQSGKGPDEMPGMQHDVPVPK
jgi:hypothetical protein